MLEQCTMQQIVVALVKGRPWFNQQHQGSDPYYGSRVHGGEAVPAGSAQRNEEGAGVGGGKERMDMIILEGWWHPGQPLALTSRQLLKERFGYLVCWSKRSMFVVIFFGSFLLVWWLHIKLLLPFSTVLNATFFKSMIMQWTGSPFLCTSPLMNKTWIHLIFAMPLLNCSYLPCT
jgi:hypothetical protein